ncbi:MAG: GTPase ObgE [Phycisphaerae bacterium]|nr:GTPase ObgE [Phycisphaerae bacterium]
MLIDTAIITVRSGRGGNGSNVFRREKGAPKGGPDGGDGGDGGDVILVGDPHLDTLVEFAFKVHYFAEDGEKGTRKKCHGSQGHDLRLRLPLGSLVYDAETAELIVDIKEAGQEFVIAKGGRGGRGNDRFKTSTHQAPTECEPGGEAIERKLRVELKLIADVGLIGLPNAGKSTWLKAISRANPKVAAYPFTTLTPQLGIAELPAARSGKSGSSASNAERRLVVADIPGLIEGASEGAGLGHDFLKHIERTSVLVHMLDVMPPDGSDPVKNYRAIRGELDAFSSELAEKPELIAFNKLDLVADEDREPLLRRLRSRLRCTKDESVAISGATGEGRPELLEKCWKLVHGDTVAATVW